VGILFLGENFAEDAAFFLFLPVHLSLLLNPSLREQVVIFCKAPAVRPKAFGRRLRFVAGEQGLGIRKRQRVRGLPPFRKERERIAHPPLKEGQDSKNLGCATCRKPIVEALATFQEQSMLNERIGDFALSEATSAFSALALVLAK
jgi:hypothetical protein